MTHRWVKAAEPRSRSGRRAKVHRACDAVERVAARSRSTNCDGEIFATDNICTHAYAKLSDGWIERGEIECPLHAGRFDIRTGKATAPPCADDLKTYPVAWSKAAKSRCSSDSARRTPAGRAR